MIDDCSRNCVGLNVNTLQRGLKPPVPCSIPFWFGTTAVSVSFHLQSRTQEDSIAGRLTSSARHPVHRRPSTTKTDLSDAHARTRVLAQLTRCPYSSVSACGTDPLQL
eukprot:5975826-Pleurochrysis_carterae.AAC.1